jgi:hypothetical protein
MTETPVKKVKGSLYKPPTERPDETNISLGQYIDDAKVRWQIHLYEWDEFSNDVIVPTAKTIYSWSVKTIDSLKEWQKQQASSGTVEKVSTERVGKDMDNL